MAHPTPSLGPSGQLHLCRVWLTRLPLWALLANSTYGIVLIALERYVAVIYPLWYNVRINERFLQFSIGKTETNCIYLVALKHKHTYRVRKNQPIYACLQLQSLRPHMMLRMRSYILLRFFLFRTPFSEVIVRNSIKWANLIVQIGQKSRSQCKVMYLCNAIIRQWIRSARTETANLAWRRN